MAAYRELEPPPSLAHHVHCLWSYAGREDGAEQAVPPDGRCELIVHRGVVYDERGVDDHAWHPQPSVLFAGQLTRPLLLRAHGDVDVLAVRFKPAGAWAFVGRSLASFTDRRVALDASLDAARDPWTPVVDFVARRIAQHGARRDAAIERCVDRLYADDGRATPRDLVALSGLPARQLQRRFATVVGIAPRELAAVVRLRRVFDALRDAPFATWSERAQAAGFFDHPQMSRDFRRMIGTTPTAWTGAGAGLATSLVSQPYKTAR